MKMTKTKKISLILGLLIAVSIIFTIYQLPVSEEIQNIISFPLFIIICGMIGAPLYIFVIMFAHNVPTDLLLVGMFAITVTISSVTYWIKNKEKKISKYILGLGIMSWVYLGYLGLGMD